MLAPSGHRSLIRLGIMVGFVSLGFGAPAALAQLPDKAPWPTSEAPAPAPSPSASSSVPPSSSAPTTPSAGPPTASFPPPTGTASTSPPPPAAPPSAAPPPVSATGPEPTLAEGDRLRAIGDLRGALRIFRALLARGPSAPLGLRVAETEDALFRHGPAYDAYAELLLRHTSELQPQVRERVEQRLIELSQTTGVITLVGTPPGTEVRVDGEMVGTIPLPRPLRLTRGDRRVDLFKQDFEIRSLSVLVSATPTEVPAELTPVSTTGTLSVRGTTSEPAELYVNEQLVGPLPVSVELQAGTHQIKAVGPRVMSSVLKVTIRRRESTPVALDLFPRPGEVDIDALMTDCSIVVDGVVVGQGRYRGALPAGRHEIEFRRRGFAVQRQTVMLEPGQLSSLRAGPFLAQTGTPGGAPSSALARDAEGRAAPEEEPEDPYNGLYGQVFVPLMLGGPATHSYADQCPAEAYHGGCTVTAPKGGGLALRLGYSFLDWIGIEALAAGAVDVTIAQFAIPAEAISVPDSPITQDLIDLAGRSAFVRAGGLFGGGLRINTPLQGIRFSLGVDYVYVTRKIFAIPDSFTGANLAYSVPGWFIDGGVQLGGTPGGRLYLGFFYFTESPHNLPLDRDLSALGLTPEQTAVADELVSMTIYRGRQTFFGPLLGIAFGH